MKKPTQADSPRENNALRVPGLMLLAAGLLPACGAEAFELPFKGMDSVAIVKSLEAGRAVPKAMLESLRSTYCKDVAEKKRAIARLDEISARSIEGLRVGSFATYRVKSWEGKESGPTVHEETWIVGGVDANGTRVIVEGPDGSQAQRTVTDSEMRPRLKIEADNPLTCLAVANFFSQPEAARTQVGERVFAGLRFKRSGLGGLDGTAVVTHEVPFAILSLESNVQGKKGGIRIERTLLRYGRK